MTGKMIDDVLPERDGIDSAIKFDLLKDMRCRCADYKRMMR